MEPWHTEVATICNKIIVAELLTFHHLRYFASRQDSRLMLIFCYPQLKIFVDNPMSFTSLIYHSVPIPCHFMSMIFPRYRLPTSFRVKATPDFGWGSLPPALPDRAVCNAHNWLDVFQVVYLFYIVSLSKLKLYLPLYRSFVRIATSNIDNIDLAFIRDALMEGCPAEIFPDQLTCSISS